MTAVTRLAGRVAHVFPDDYDVDQIVGVDNIKVQDLDRLVALACERLGPAFATGVRAGDLLVGGANFGYGHPHFPAMRAMRRLGIAAVVADSFFPVYWRGEISNGFPQVACAGIAAHARAGDAIEIDIEAAQVRLPARGLVLPCTRWSDTEARILAAGGFRAWLAASIAADRDPSPSPIDPGALR